MSDPDPGHEPRLADLVQHIISTHHETVRAQLPRFEAAVLGAIRQGRLGHTRTAGPRKSAERLVQQFRIETENHLRKEEVVLFPLILDLEVRAAAGEPPARHPFGSLATLIQIMEAEHELTHHQLERLTALIESGCAEEAPIWAGARRRLAEVVADMTVHTRIEDDMLFPRTIRLESDR
jgi:regulator of cell morphogenesis and NO signaling